MDIFWISFESGVLRWWLESLLLPSIREILVRSIYFRESLSCLQDGDFNLGVFAGDPQLAWIGFVLYQGVLSTFIVIYDCILLLFCRSCFSFVIRKIWYCWHLLGRKGGIGHLEQNVGLRNHIALLKLIGIAGIITFKASTRIFR